MTESGGKTSIFGHFLVGVTGFEPAASTSQMSRATNCATPRCIKLYQRKLEKSSSTVVVKYRVKT